MHTVLTTAGYEMVTPFVRLWHLPPPRSVLAASTVCACLLLLLVVPAGATGWWMGIPSPEHPGGMDIVPIMKDSELVQGSDGAPQVATRLSLSSAERVLSHPSISAVTPTWGRWGSSATLVLSGEDLSDVVRVVLNRTGNPNLSASTGVVATGTTVSAPLTLWSPLRPSLWGPWNITVATSDGTEATLIGPFELVPPPKVTSCNVSSGRRGTTVPFRIEGTDFMGTPASLRVDLSGMSGTPVTVPATIIQVSRTVVEGWFEIPLETPLLWYEIVVRDVDGVYNIYNNPFAVIEAPSIAAVTPPYLRRDGEPTALVVTGNGVGEATVVRLQSAGRDLINTSPRAINGSAVEATFTAPADTPLGDRTLAVTLPGGTEIVRTGGVTVIANPRPTGMNVTDAVTGDAAITLAIEGTDLVPGQLELRDGPIPVMLPGLASIDDGVVIWTGSLIGVLPGTYQLWVHGVSPLEYAVPARLTIHPSEVQARIVADRLFGTQPLSISFRGDVTGYADHFSWSFGDGSPDASTQNASHTYSTPGTYRVSFVAGNRVETNSVWTDVVVSSSLQASFSAYPQSGPVPLQVRFLDYSTGNPTSWSWSFGDGSTSTDREPMHVYTDPGRYTPTLLITDATGASSMRSLELGIVATNTLTPAPTITPTPTVNVTVTSNVTVTPTVNRTPTVIITPDITTLPTGTVSPTMTAALGPYPAPHVAPCRIEAEDYDIGGYSDTTPGNEGGTYRQDDVDIETMYGPTNVGWIRPGEWLVYSIDVNEAGVYALTCRVANPGIVKPVAVLVDDVTVAQVTVPGTGSFGIFADTVSSSFPLAPGRHRIRLAFGPSGSFNLDSFDVRHAGEPNPTLTVSPTPIAGGASFVAIPLKAPRGSRVKFTLIPPAGRTVKTVWWSFDSPAHRYTWNSRIVNPSFYYPVRGTFSPFVKIIYTDNSNEVVHRPGYIRMT